MAGLAVPDYTAMVTSGAIVAKSDRVCIPNTKLIYDIGVHYPYHVNLIASAATGSSGVDPAAAIAAAIVAATASTEASSGPFEPYSKEDMEKFTTQMPQLSSELKRYIRSNGGKQPHPGQVLSNGQTVGEFSFWKLVLTKRLKHALSAHRRSRSRSRSESISESHSHSPSPTRSRWSSPPSSSQSRSRSK